MLFQEKSGKIRKNRSYLPLNGQVFFKKSDGHGPENLCGIVRTVNGAEKRLFFAFLAKKRRKIAKIFFRAGAVTDIAQKSLL